jgi:primosomal protein N' (replication factor Y) (superfamily II helicase)
MDLPLRPETLLPHQWVEVLVDCPGIQGLYTYRSDSTIAVGDIVSVPFGNQILGAIVIHLQSQPPVDLDPAAIKEVGEVICPRFFAPEYWELLRRVATYYHTPLIQVIRMALPPGILGRSQRRVRLVGKAEQWGDPTLLATARKLIELLKSSPDKEYSWQYLMQQVRGGAAGMRQLHKLKLVTSYLEPPKVAKPKQQLSVILTGNPRNLELTLRQREILLILQNHGGDLLLTELEKLAKTTKKTLANLESDGYVQIIDREILRRDRTSGIWQEAGNYELNPAQQEVVAGITNRLGSFAPILLHGVTGSGKTAVYMQAIEQVIERQQSAIVLVPEIGLTPQLTDRFRARFGDRILVYHSALADGERYDTWRQMLLPIPQIVIGTRSAIFAPLPNLGLIVLDEEHDGSFKQDQPMPTYHAGLLAEWRAQALGIPVVRGSATPALETWQAAQASCYLSLPERVTGRGLPLVEVVDMREELKQGNRSIFSTALQQAIRAIAPASANGSPESGREQAILFIHRRGHSTFVSCRSCGEALGCPNCDVSLAYHQDRHQQPLLRCHYCNYVAMQPKTCPSCDSAYLKHFGSGTQKVMEELTQHFPQLRCLRFDSDTTRNKGMHREILTEFAEGKADILVGTQMLAKGIDLPQVTMVGIIAADGLLNMPDYRAAERTFQTLTQVVGRCGRGDRPGKAILQTYNPEHPTIGAVVTQDYHRFLAGEMAVRKDFLYPPYGRMILLRLSGTDGARVEAEAERLAASISEGSSRCQVLGPSPATVMRVANRFRWQIVLKYPLETALELPDLPAVAEGVSLSIDVEPLNFL